MTQGKCFFQKQILSDATTPAEKQVYYIASFGAFPATRCNSVNSTDSTDQNPLKN